MAPFLTSLIVERRNLPNHSVLDHMLMVHASRSV